MSVLSVPMGFLKNVGQFDPAFLLAMANIHIYNMFRPFFSIDTLFAILILLQTVASLRKKLLKTLNTQTVNNSIKSKTNSLDITTKHKLQI